MRKFPTKVNKLRYEHSILESRPENEHYQYPSLNHPIDLEITPSGKVVCITFT